MASKALLVMGLLLLALSLAICSEVAARDLAEVVNEKEQEHAHTERTRLTEAKEHAHTERTRLTEAQEDAHTERTRLSEAEALKPDTAATAGAAHTRLTNKVVGARD